MDRLEHLKEAQRLERLWDNVAGEDNDPRRKALEPRIKFHRSEYERMTYEAIHGTQKKVATRSS